MPGGLPTRLLATQPGHTRLILSKYLPVTTQYATLSHCWGTLKIAQLEKDTLKEFLKHLPYDSLCKTFQDAFDMAYEFGFEYIWIDSLCIVQDDENDVSIIY